MTNPLFSIDANVLHTVTGGQTSGGDVRPPAVPDGELGGKRSETLGSLGGERSNAAGSLGGEYSAPYPR